MRIFKNAAVALVIAAMTGCWFVPSAQANEEVVFCSVNESPCVGEGFSGYAFSASAEATFDFGEAGKVKCSSSISRSESEQITALTFTKCSEGCSVEAKGLPYTADISAPNEGSGKLSMSNSGSGAPKLAFKCGAAECTYGGTLSEIAVKGGSPAEVQVSKSLTEEAKTILCQKSMKWEANYKFTSPESAMYVAPGALQGPTFCEVSEEPCPQESIVSEPKFQLDSNAALPLPFHVYVGWGAWAFCNKGSLTLRNAKPYRPGGDWRFEPGLVSNCKGGGVTCKDESPPRSLPASLFPYEYVALNDGPEVTLNCSGVGICSYAGNGETLEFFGGTPATLELLVWVTRQEPSLCPEETTLGASYVAAAPETLYLSES